MKRYSRAYLKKHPEKKGKDLETTRRACEKYQNFPVSVINFLEGTRFTPAKHAKQESPHTHLLRPKAGGIAFVLSAMGEMFDAILDVTIVYPQGNPTFWDFVSGQIPRVVVDVRQIPVDPAFVAGDYTGDAAFRAEFQAWVRDLWAEKDEIIEDILREEDEAQTPEEETAVSQPDQLPTP
jgi:1-acyl-sn-glycerol-3-phosphate acyltransferase